MVRLRRLVPVGAGESDYCDALVDPAVRRHAAARLMTALLAAADGCDEVLLSDLRAGSPLLGRGARRLERRRCTRARPARC